MFLRSSRFTGVTAACQLLELPLHHPAQFCASCAKYGRFLSILMGTPCLYLALPRRSALHLLRPVQALDGVRRFMFNLFALYTPFI